MRGGILLSYLTLAAVAPARPTTDYSMPLIEYRVIKATGQVRLTAGFVHDPRTQEAMLKHVAALDREGIILIAGASLREVRHRDDLRGHRVETAVTVYPPVGHGYRGGVATASIVVTVDGKKRIDCPWADGPVDLADVAILPVDGMISISGTYDTGHVSGYIFLDRDQLIDQAWLERTAK